MQNNRVQYTVAAKQSNEKYKGEVFALHPCFIFVECFNVPNSSGVLIKESPFAYPFSLCRLRGQNVDKSEKQNKKNSQTEVQESLKFGEKP